MLFKRRDLDAIVAGDVTLAFRRWKRPMVVAGGRLRTAVGELGIEAVEVVTLASLTRDEAHAAGFETLAALRGALRGGQGKLYRVRLHFAGADRRIALREESRVSAADLADVLERLQRMDARSTDGAWTARVLRELARSPGVRAGDLATELDMLRLAFKQRVRRLKELGLTESLEVGYRLSPRGRTVLARLPAARGEE